VRPNLLWQGQLRGHQERRPVDGVEADDVFADKMHIGGHMPRFS